MRSLLSRLFLIALLATTFIPALPAPVSAANVIFSCWCQDETTRTCNHHTVDSGIPATDDAWSFIYTPRGSDGNFTGNSPVSTVVGAMSLTPARREELLGLCRARCSADGGKGAINYETTYREEICEECNADPNSSCTEDRGARLAFGDAQVEQQIAACEERQAKAALLPMKLAVPIGGIDQVAGLADYINVAYRYLVTVVLVVAIVMVVYGGFRYLVGASIGDIQAGKKIIVDAIVGMLIVLGAYTILSTVNPNTVLLTFAPPEPIECADLALPEAIKNARCTSGSDCGEGQRCVAGVNYVFSTEGAGEVARTGGGAGRQVGSSIGEEDVDVGTAALAGGVAVGVVTAGIGAPGGAILAGGGAMIWNLIPSGARKAALELVGETIGGSAGVYAGIGTEIIQDVRDISVCSTGEKGSPCLEENQCDAQYGSCIDSWKICWTTSGNQPGEPCDSDGQCSNGSCVPVVPRSLGSRIVDVTAGGNADPDYPFKVCEIEVSDSTPCFRPNNGQSATVFPIQCNGLNAPGLDFVCAWCPSGAGGSERVWSPLLPLIPFPAQCKPRDVLGTRCAP
ncbi:MAG: hypothetical protein AAB668_02295 [Patescibacteria group bacterium]